MFDISFPTINFGAKVMIVLAIVVVVMNFANLGQYKRYFGLS